MDKIDSGRPRYIGETKDQLRDGFGIYQYPNSFFKYEGEWTSGVKHGHGKLAMKDGSFYEGQFINGEIEGMGVKKWTYNDNIYEGQFVKGELCGNGIMRYGNGDLYEGGWVDNMREGDGILTGASGSMYKGSFHKHKKHGEGTQYYSNDEQYEGGWICGMRHGHGIMKFADGSIYGGQWRSDMLNGQGSFIHCSGVSFEGIWINGRPEHEVTNIVISGNTEIEVEQGQTFNFEVECRTDDGEIPPECGRVLQVTAGIKFGASNTAMSPKCARSVSSNSANAKENLTNTPFGFDVEPYPLIELPATDSQQTSDTVVVSNDSGSTTKGQSQLSPITDQSPDELNVQDNKDKQPKDPVVNDQPEPHLSKVTFQDQSEGRFFPNKASLNLAGTDHEDEKQDEAIQEGDPTITMRTVNGQVFFENILIPPPHGLRRSLSRSSPESVDGRTSAANKWRKNDPSFAGSALKVPSNTASAVEKDKRKGGSSEHGSIASESDKSREVAPTPASKKRKDKKDEKPPDKDDKLCKPGDYVVIVQDATSPPFLDTTLKPAFLHVKIIPRTGRRSKSKEVRK